ncbi:hypothetical protein [Chitinophaga pinensis]|uniref:YD repeat-containing protein n=1 Tax=Chitinophaga pinensis (strain ATCC 43595 / DSM 2588 / LMG 13176 / NBRC 15968 / NCIMB 11800 / UQM 2034) TaxID=485918 RepID=A0A979GAJ4_CHIPD|nr:hypothetical protein [Chitinophaga pinensis]ACU63721.1 hypothetical protein Cpin_6316 [Chitinophaga pinensis DSM 2588]
MNYIRLSFTLLVVSATLFSAGCKKDDNSSPVDGQTPEDTPTLTTVTYHKDLAVSDNVLLTDKFYYKNGLLTQVDASTATSLSVQYNFSYNSDGSLAKIVSFDVAQTKAYYYFHYVNNRLDSLTVTDTLRGGFPGNLMGFRMSYNSNGKLTGILMNVLEAGETVPYDYTRWSYHRGANGKLDSLTGQYNPEIGTAVRRIYTSGEASPVAMAMKKLPAAYLMVLAIRKKAVLLSVVANNLYFHQFLNPDDNLFNSGTFKAGSTPEELYPYQWPDYKYNIDAVLNADGRLTQVQYTDNYRGEMEGDGGCKFFYR